MRWAAPIAPVARARRLPQSPSRLPSQSPCLLSIMRPSAMFPLCSHPPSAACPTDGDTVVECRRRVLLPSRFHAPPFGLVFREGAYVRMYVCVGRPVREETGEFSSPTVDCRFECSQSEMPLCFAPLSLRRPRRLKRSSSFVRARGDRWGIKFTLQLFFCIDGRVRGWLGRPALKWFSLLSGLSPLSHLSVGKRLTLKKKFPFCDEIRAAGLKCWQAKCNLKIEWMHAGPPKPACPCIPTIIAIHATPIH